MRKATIRLLETEVQERTRFVLVTVFVPDNLTADETALFAAELHVEGEATSKPCPGTDGEWSQWADKDMRVSV